MSDPAPADPAPAPAPKPAPTPDPSPGAAEHWRTKAAAVEAKLADADRAATKLREDHAAALATAKAEHDRALAEVRTAAEQRHVRAELRAAAKEAGAVDAADVLALADTKAVKLNDDGEVTNAAEVIAALKKAKPHLFGGTGTSSTAPAPKPGEPTAKKATDMTAEEYAAAKAALLKRR